MGNHCVEQECYECGYYSCLRCSSHGISYIPSGSLYKRYLEDKQNNNLAEYSDCPNCGKTALR